MNTRNGVSLGSILVLAGFMAVGLGGCPANNGGNSNTNNSNENSNINSGHMVPNNVAAEVSIKNFTFSPKAVTIQAGQAVHWTNGDPRGIHHTVTSGNPGDSDAGALFDSGNIESGSDFTKTFDTAGEYVYFCIPHQFMESMRGARVIVEPAGQ